MSSINLEDRPRAYLCRQLRLCRKEINKLKVKNTYLGKKLETEKQATEYWKQLYNKSMARSRR